MPFTFITGGNQPRTAATIYFIPYYPFSAEKLQLLSTPAAFVFCHKNAPLNYSAHKRFKFLCFIARAQEISINKFSCPLQKNIPPYEIQKPAQPFSPVLPFSA